MRRRRPDPSKAVSPVVTDAELERRLRNLWRGAQCYLLLDPHHDRYAEEKAAAEAIAHADDERRPLTARVQAREALLDQMGRLDRALRHTRSMEAAGARWREGRNRV